MEVRRHELEDRLFAILSEIANGQLNRRSELISTLTQFPDLTGALIGAAVRNAGDAAATTLMRAHLQEPQWSHWLPLRAQEFSAVLRDEPQFHLPLASALTRSGWAAERLAPLLDPNGTPSRAAEQLLNDLRGIAAEAAEAVQALPAMRARRRDDLSVVQVQLLVRLEAALGKLEGRRILEVGPQYGGVFRDLLRQGADAWALDLEPLFQHPRALKGDFMHADLPGPFDAVVASAVFEPGSTVAEHDPRNNASAVLARFKELTKPGGLVVLETICFPIQFTLEEARQAGFELVPCRVPCVTSMASDTGTALRLTADEQLVVVERLPDEIAPTVTVPRRANGDIPELPEETLRRFALGGRGCVLRHA